MHIFICGFMGAGKSYLLEQLKSRLLKNEMRHTRILDLDHEITSNQLQQSAISIADFINENGISEFRELEYNELSNLIQDEKTHLILSLGGGTLENQNSLELILRSGSLLWLNIDFNICFERIKNNKSRPLALNNKEEMNKLFLSRIPNYKKCEFEGSMESLVLKIKEKTQK